jgi:hypothetical protein
MILPPSLSPSPLPRSVAFTRASPLPVVSSKLAEPFTNCLTRRDNPGSIILVARRTGMTWDEQFELNKRRIADEYAWFDENRSSIIKDHYNEEAVIRDHRVWGYFPDTSTATAFMTDQGIEEGSYAIQDCLSREDESARYHNVYMDIGGAYA